MLPEPRISLGAALVPGADAAEDCCVLTEQIPGSWVDLFESEHADGAVWHGLFTSCRAGRDWALRRARKVKVTVDRRFRTDLEQVERFLTQPLVRKRIALQGLPPEIDILHSDAPCSVDGATAIIRDLAQVAPGVTVLGVGFTWSIQPLGSGAILSVAAAALPQLTSVTVKNAIDRLPPPGKLPNVRHIRFTVKRNPEAVTVLDSLAPYLSQLTSLDMHFSDQPHYPWSVHMGSPGKPNHTLTSLHTSTALTAAALSFITAFLPALQKLHVCSLDVSEEQGAGKTWAVGELRVARDGPVTGTQLARLPATVEGGILTLCGDECVVQLDITGTEGFDIGVRERLSTWRLQVNNIDLRMSPNVPATAQPEALRNTLTQLATLPHPPPIHARGSGWHWTEAMRHLLDKAPANAPTIHATNGP